MLLWKSSKYYILNVCLYYCLSHPACKVLICAPYDTIRSLSLCTTLCTQCLIKACFTQNKNIEHKMCVSILPITYVRNISHCKKNLPCYYHKCTEFSSSRQVAIILTRFRTNLDFHRKFSKKKLKYEIS